MGRVLTNNVALSYTIESSLGVAGTTWFQLEFNTLSAFGATIETVARSPISKNRQRRKGIVVDLDSAVELENDLTISAFRDFAEGFVFATGINTDVTRLAVTEAATAADEYSVAALTADQADKFEIDTLIWVTGFTTAANNGLKVVDADISTSATEISVAENLVDETTAAQLSFAGHQIATADVVTWTWDAGELQATLNLTGVVAAMQALGLTPGMEVHVGGPDGSGGVQNAFENSATDDMFGYARVLSFSGADDIVFDKVAAALQFTDGTDPAAPVDLLFGEFIRNVEVDDSEFLERTFQIEAEFPNLAAAAGLSEFQYSIGNLCDALSFTLPLTDKAGLTIGLMGTDTEDPVLVAGRKSGASTATAPDMTDAFGTSSDVATLRVTDADESGLSTDFKSMTMTLSNSVSPEKVIGQLGAKFMNFGNFEVDIEAQLLFTNADVIDRIRANTTVTMDFVVENSDGAIYVDIPSMTLGGGGRDFPVNESVLVNLTGQAFLDPIFNTSIGISIFPVVP